MSRRNLLTFSLILLLIPLSLSLILNLVYAFPRYVTATSISIPTTVYFGFASGDYFKFSTSTSFTSIYRENNYWHLGGYGLHIQGANMTVTKYFTDNEFRATVTGISTSNLNIYTYDKGPPVSVRNNGNDLSGWTYDSGARVLSLSLPSGENNILVIWSGGAEAAYWFEQSAEVYSAIFMLTIILSVAVFISQLSKGVDFSHALLETVLTSMILIAAILILASVFRHL